MGKMISYSLQGAFGVKVLPIISLVIFVLLFIWLMFWVFNKDRNYIDTMKNLPIDSDDNHQEEIEHIKI